MEYKRFDLAVNFNGVSGNKIYNHTAMTNFYKGMLATSNNVVPDAIEYPEEAITNAALVSTRYLEDGSFLRMKTLRIGYDLNRILKNRFNALQIYFQGSNLFTLTKYSGLDPEIAGAGINMGIDSGAWPTRQQFIFGITFGL